MPALEFAIRQEAQVQEIKRLFSLHDGVVVESFKMNDCVIALEIYHPETGAQIGGGVCNELLIDPKKLTNKYRYDTPLSSATMYYYGLLSALKQEVRKIAALSKGKIDHHKIDLLK